MCFTNWGLLFWMSVDEGMDEAVKCKFSMVDKVLIHFREKFDSRRLQVFELQSECQAGSVSSQVLSRAPVTERRADENDASQSESV